MIRHLCPPALLLLLPCQLGICRLAAALEPVPEKLIVLTFDDSVKSHFTVVRPILLRYGFGATFFITEGFDFPTNKEDYMTWGEIAELHRDGFEIGNHTRDHMGVTEETLPRLAEQIEAINVRCRAVGIPRTVTFAYPGNAFAAGAFPILRDHGIRFARRGGAPEWPYEAGKGFAYQPGLEHPLRIPSAGDARPDWEMDDFLRAVDQAREGRIAVLQFHGVPDRAHPWVHTGRQKFEAYMHYLATHDYRVIAMRDLARYVDPQVEPNDADGVIEDRQRSIAKGFSRENGRRPVGERRLPVPPFRSAVSRLPTWPDRTFEGMAVVLRGDGHRGGAEADRSDRLGPLSGRAANRRPVPTVVASKSITVPNRPHHEPNQSDRRRLLPGPRAVCRVGGRYGRGHWPLGRSIDFAALLAR